jgi:O-antigen ligase
MTSITTDRPVLRQAAGSLHAARDGSRLLSITTAAVSFECVFVLFLFSGQYKADPRFEWLPLDATILFGLINAMQGLVLLCDRRFKPNPVGLPAFIAGVAFAAYVFASTLWATGQHYAQYKSAYVGTINLWCLAAGALVISSTPERLRRFLADLVLFASWIGVECLLSYAHQAQYGRVMQLHAMAGESAYIGLGRVVTWGAVVCAVVWMHPRSIGWPLWSSRLVSLLAMLFFGITAAMIGARGPIVAAAGSLVLVGLLYSSTKLNEKIAQNTLRLGSLATACVAAAFAYRAWMGEFPLLVQRFLAFSSQSEFYDSSGQSMMRLELFSAAIEGWLEKPLHGQGVGGFSVVWANIDERLFPHNMALELLCELGLLGAVLFAMIVLLATRGNVTSWRTTSAGMKAMVVALAASAFANTMTSGDLPDNRVVFFAIGLLAFRAPQLRTAEMVASRYPHTQSPTPQIGLRLASQRPSAPRLVNTASPLASRQHQSPRPGSSR